jgi:uncharacterized membrane protein YgcG
MSKPSTTSLPSVDDAFNPKLNVSCLDFLLIELVPLAQRITDQLHQREQALIEEFRRSKIFNNNNNSNTTTTTLPSRNSDPSPSTIPPGPRPESETPEHESRSTAPATDPHAGVAPTTATKENDGSGKTGQDGGGGDGGGGGGGGGGGPGSVSISALGGAPLLDSQTQEAVFWRLDNLGYRVGQGLVER